MKSSRTKELVRSVILWIVTVFLSVLLTVAALFAAFGAVFHRTSTMLSAAEKVEYVDKLRKTLSEQYASIALTTGVPEELSDRFVAEYVTDEIALYPILHFAEGGTPDLTAFREAVLKDVRQLAKDMEERGELTFSTDEERTELDESLVSLSEIYTVYLENAVRMRGVYSKVEVVSGFYGGLQKYILPGLAAFLILAIALLLPIARKNPFPYLYAAFGSAGALCVGVPAVLLTKGILKDLALDPVYVRDWLAELVHQFLRITLWIGAGYLIAAALFGALAWIRHRKQMKCQTEKKEGAL